MYPMIVSNAFSLCFISRKSGATEALKKCLADFIFPHKLWWCDQITAVSSTKENSESFAEKEI